VRPEARREGIPTVSTSKAAAPVPEPAPKELAPDEKFRELMSRGIAAADRDALGDALRAFRQAMKVNPRDPGAWNSLGVVLVRQGNLSGGVEALRQALNVDATYAPAHRNLGIALERQGRSREAYGHYRSFLLLVSEDHPDRDAVRQRLAVPFRHVPIP
jgi:Flp pilus assembly protein TadD